MSKKSLVLILAVVTMGCAGVVAGGVWAYGQVFADPTANSLAYADQIKINGGYADISRYGGGGGSCNCVQRWYIGPAKTDPMTAFTGPDLAWVPVPRVHPQPPGGDPVGWTDLAWADTTTHATGSCEVDLVAETPQYLGIDDVIAISSAQAARWQGNQLRVVEIDVACDRDAGK